METFAAIFDVVYQLFDNIGFLILAASGLVIIFGMMGVINMAHGELMMIGAYITAFSYHAGIPEIIKHNESGSDNFPPKISEASSDASENDDPYIVRALLAAGANVTLKAPDGKTAAEVSACSCCGLARAKWRSIAQRMTSGPPCTPNGAPHASGRAPSE